jgi:hypothetical protein
MPNYGRWLAMLNQPLHMMAIEAAVKCFGSFRAKEQLGLIQPRPNYAYGLLRAADQCRWLGIRKTTVIEFGVAAGAGLMAMINIAEQVTRQTGVEFRIVGFDSGQGLPHFEGYKDHPELWIPGDFAMPDRTQLERRVQGRAELVFGDIADTVAPFIQTLTSDAPLGFISVDVDLYSATVSALRVLTGEPEKYNPAIAVYLDDFTTYFGNRWCGELAAVEEFNTAQDYRKIDKDYTLPGRRPHKSMSWYNRMFVAHVLDHDLRTRIRTSEEAQRLPDEGLISG